VYVLNAGGTPNITGFRLHQNRLTPIAGSTRALPAGSAPAQVSFSPDGAFLAVTLKARNQIAVFPVVDGLAGAPVYSPSAGQTPFRLFLQA
jgi:6-phosphogluconolactonase